MSFEGSGCAILLASASLLTLALMGKTKEEAQTIAERFHGLLTADDPPDEDGLGDLLALAGVQNYPSRIKCATLPWHGLLAALEAGG